jgi:hydrogenase maturation protease
MTVLIIGLGHPDRGDDAAGLIAAQALGPDPAPGVRVLAAPAGLVSVLEELVDVDRAVLVDAVRSGAIPGTLHTVDLVHAPLRHDTAASTHGVDVPGAIELARTLDWLPPEAVLVGVEAADLRVGAPMDPRVRAALPRLIALAMTAATEVHRVPG